MLYKNISGKPKYVVCASVKQLIQPGAVVNLSQSDIRHAGSSMRFFESVYKSQEIVNDLLRRQGVDVSAKEEPAVVEKEAVESPIVKEVSKDIEETIEEPVIEDSADDVVEGVEELPEVPASSSVARPTKNRFDEEAIEPTERIAPHMMNQDSEEDEVEVTEEA